MARNIIALANDKDFAAGNAIAYKIAPKKSPAVAGKLNGQDATFTLTSGKGQAADGQVAYYAYFTLDGQLYYFKTVQPLPAGAVVTVTLAAKVAPAEVKEAAPVTPIKDVVTGTQAKRASKRPSKVTKVA